MKTYDFSTALDKREAAQKKIDDSPEAMLAFWKRERAEHEKSQPANPEDWADPWYDLDAVLYNTITQLEAGIFEAITKTFAEYNERYTTYSKTVAWLRGTLVRSNAAAPAEPPYQDAVFNHFWQRGWDYADKYEATSIYRRATRLEKLTVVEDGIETDIRVYTRFYADGSIKYLAAGDGCSHVESGEEFDTRDEAIRSIIEWIHYE